MARPAQRMGDGAPELDWELLYDVYASRLRRVIRRRVPRDAVEDVLQDAFLHAFKSRATIDPARPIYPWLATVAVRTTTEWSRRRLRSLPVGGAPSDSEEAPLDSLEEEVLNRARRVGIKHAFASLNERQRRLLQLVTIEGLSYERAADIEGISTEAARSAIARARTNFKTSFSDFEQREGLLGIAILGPVLRVLYGRWRRLQFLLGGQTASLGAATLTAAMVAVTAVPFPKQPTQPSRPILVVPAVALARTQQGSTQAVTSASPVAATTSAARSDHAPSAVSANDSAVKARVSNDGTSTRADYGGSFADDDVWVAGFMEMHCDRNPTTKLQCAVLRNTPLPDEGGQ